ncbi:MAG: restriction endonuclease [Anaerolineae bacterium]|jgi:HJR/Mrr/RecB family endonuclease
MWTVLFAPYRFRECSDKVMIHLLSFGCTIRWFDRLGFDHLQQFVWIIRFKLSQMNSFLATFIRLAVLVALLLVVIVFVRVLIELKIEQRRRKKLVTTRNLGSLSPSDFEAYVGLLFERAGYRVKRTGRSGDRGIDLVVHRNGRTSVVQCKRYEDNIGPGTVRELIGTMTNAGADHGFLVTTSDFTAGAEREARKAPYRIGLVDGERLVRWARRYGLPGELMDEGRGAGVR